MQVFGFRIGEKAKKLILLAAMAEELSPSEFARKALNERVLRVFERKDVKPNYNPKG